MLLYIVYIIEYILLEKIDYIFFIANDNVLKLYYIPLNRINFVCIHLQNFTVLFPTVYTFVYNT